MGGCVVAPRSCMAGSLEDHRPSQPYNTRTEHVGSGRPLVFFFPIVVPYVYRRNMGIGGGFLSGAQGVEAGVSGEWRLAGVFGWTFGTIFFFFRVCRHWLITLRGGFGLQRGG